uniref:Uncharacterized protein n=1 Tax=Anguilla anguilla TaxID=7936 RepID=A0A0E9XEU7_ANGAN
MRLDSHPAQLVHSGAPDSAEGVVEWRTQRRKWKWSQMKSSKSGTKMKKDFCKLTLFSDPYVLAFFP